MSTTSNSSERYWALKSTNLKRIKGDGIKKKKSKQIINNANDTFSNRSTMTDIRKSSYPVLPDVPFSNRSQSSLSRNSKDSLNLTDFESTRTSDYGSDMSTRLSPQRPYQTPQRVIDNKSYYDFYSNKNPRVTSEKKNLYDKRIGDKSSKKFILRTEQKHVNLVKNQNRMNLQFFHAIQLVSLEIIDETLDDEIVLDVMIDAFKEIQHEVEQFNMMIGPVVRLTAEQILSESIDQIIHETVLMSIIKDSKSHLRAQIVLRWTLDDMVQSLLTELSHDAIHDMVNEKLQMTRSEHVFGKLVDEFIGEDIKCFEKIMMKESLLEIILDEEVVCPVLEDSLRDISKDMLEYYHQKINRINLQQINSLATEGPLASMVMSHLVSVGTKQKTVYGPSLIAQYCFESFVLDILLSKTDEIFDKLISTVESKFISNFHQEANQIIASESLLTELIEHSDADLCDLDAEEVEESYIPRYIGDIEKSIYSVNPQN